MYRLASLPILVTLLLVLPTFSIAQVPPLDCGQLRIEITPASPANPVCGFDGTCAKQYYDVSLHTNNVPLSSFLLDYCSMTFQVNVNTPNGALSDLDALHCINPEISQMLILNKKLNTIILNIDGLTTIPDLLFENGRCQLFAFSVDHFPGEVVTITTNNDLWSNNDGAVCEPNGNSTYCNLPLGYQIPPIAWPEPSTTYLGHTFQFGSPTPAAIVSQGTTEITVPIEYKGATTQSFKYLDIEINYAANQPMLEPAITDNTGKMISSTVLPGPSNTYTFYLRFENLTVLASNPPLATLTVNEPSVASLRADVDLNFVSGRVIDINGNCDKVKVGDPTSLTFLGSSYCDPSTSRTLTVAGVADSEKCKMETQIQLFWPGATVMSEFKLKLRFDMSAGISFSSLNIGGFNCNPSIPANACPPLAQTCWEYLNNELEICWSNSQGGTPIGPSSVLIIADFISSDGGCINSVELLDATATINGQTCIPNLAFTGFPLCFPRLGGEVVKVGKSLAFEHMCEDYVTVDLIPAQGMPPFSQNTPIDAGRYSICPDPGEYNLTPINNNIMSVLDGVNILDVLKIQRHILGLEPLPSPYFLFAADVNNNGFITSSDIVDLRKVILGAWTFFPAKNSWEFIDRTFVFVNPNNPLSPKPPATATVTVQQGQSATADFVGIKTGDVTGDNFAGCPGRALLPELPLSAQISTEKPTHGIVLLNMRNLSSETLHAWQGAFRFDPTKYRFVQVIKGENVSMQPEDFDLSEIQQGLIKGAWCIMDIDGEGVQPQKSLFSVLLERLQTTQEDNEQPLQIDESKVQCLAFSSDHTPYRVSMSQKTSAAERSTLGAENDLFVKATPNPTSDLLRLQFEMKKNDRVQLLIYDAFGRRVVFREMEMAAGSQTIEVPEVATFPTGVYKWVLRSRRLVSSDVFLKH